MVKNPQSETAPAVDENHEILSEYSRRIVEQAERRRERVQAFEALRVRLGVRDFMAMARLVGFSRRRCYSLREGAEVLPEEVAIIEHFIAERERERGGDAAAAS